MLKAKVLHQMPYNRLNLLRSDLNTRKDSKDGWAGGTPVATLENVGVETTIY